MQGRPNASSHAASVAPATGTPLATTATSLMVMFTCCSSTVPTAVPSTKDTGVDREMPVAPGGGSKSVTNGCASTFTTPASVVARLSMTTGFGSLLNDGGNCKIPVHWLSVNGTA